MKFLKTNELNRPGLDDYTGMKKMPVVVVLDNVRSGLNVGSFFRTADSFMAEKLILCGITATPPEKEILKSALGATESVLWEYFASSEAAVVKLISEGYSVFAVEQSDVSVPLHNFKTEPGQKYALVFGNEVKGVDPILIPHLNGSIEIPQSGIKHSLNVSVCAGIVLWTFYEKLILETK
ncbi:MAG TPA: RNA methyltransferase [Bacteroidia bacterium]|nr:RNA methyltransferase [Bacteroidia bacterium]